MIPEQLDLARQLVKSPRFRWMGGMLAWTTNHTHLRIDSVGQTLWISAGFQGDEYRPAGTEVPDITDAGTAGCLIQLLGNHFEACGTRYDFRWWVDIVDRGLAYRGTGATLGEAAARALLAIHEVK